MDPFRSNFGPVRGFILVVTKTKTALEEPANRVPNPSNRPVSAHHLGLQVLQQVKSGEPAPWIPWPGADAIAAMARGQIDYMKQRDLVEPDEARAFDDPQLAVELQGLGIPDSRHFRRIYDESLEEKLPAAFAKLGVTI